MLLIYTPHDGERQEFVFRPGELLSPEAEVLEECGGPSWGTYPEFGEKFMAGHLKARRAALWIMLKRQNPRLKLADVIVRPDELDFDFEPHEKDRLRELLEAGELDEGQQAQLSDFMIEPVGKDEPSEESTDSS